MIHGAGDETVLQWAIQIMKIEWAVKISKLNSKKDIKLEEYSKLLERIFTNPTGPSCVLVVLRVHESCCILHSKSETKKTSRWWTLRS